MSLEDKSRLITNRFREAFENGYAAMNTGLYGYLNDNSIYDRIMKEEGHQFAESGAECSTSVTESHRIFRYCTGYENLSDDEIREKISERYNSGTLADRWGRHGNC